MRHSAWISSSNDENSTPSAYAVIFASLIVIEIPFLIRAIPVDAMSRLVPMRNNMPGLVEEAQRYLCAGTLELLATAMAIIVIWASGGGLAKLLSIRPITLRGGLIAALLPMTFLVPFTVWVFARSLPLRAYDPDAELMIWGSSYAWLPIAFMVIIAPICEEILFRGILFKLLSRTVVGPILAALISSFCFAISHAQYGLGLQMILFVEALALCYVVWRSGSILYGMISHFVLNSFLAVAMVIMAIN